PSSTRWSARVGGSGSTRSPPSETPSRGCRGARRAGSMTYLPGSGRALQGDDGLASCDGLRPGYVVGMSDVTRLLDAAVGGDPRAAGVLPPFVGGGWGNRPPGGREGEGRGKPLDAPALARGAKVGLVGGEHPRDGKGGGHFFAAGGGAMRRILVENARRK